MKHRFMSRLIYSAIGIIGMSCLPQNNLEYKISRENTKSNKPNHPYQYARGNQQQTQELQRTRQPQMNYQTTDFSGDTDEILLARMIFGESRNCSQEEKIAVGYTVINRVNKRRSYLGRTLREVILRPYQYSCFNRNDPNRRQLMDPQTYDFQSFENCLQVAGGILSGEYEDPTNGATHYFNPRSASPSWAERMTRIGRIDNSRHIFYREE